MISLRLYLRYLDAFMVFIVALVVLLKFSSIRCTLLSIIMDKSEGN